MRIFLTGATGYIGAAVTDALLRAGHEVTGLVRDHDKAARLAAKGVRPVIGTLADVDSYGPAAEGHDGYIHTAFDAAGRGIETDALTIDTLLALARQPRTGPGIAPLRFLLYTSGVWVLGRVAEAVGEDAPVNPIPLVEWRVAHEQRVLDGGSRDVRTAVIRPGVVYGGGAGLVSDLVKAASYGLVRVVGDGGNRWPVIYDRDLAELYACVAGDATASGIFHGTDDVGVRVNDLVDAIAAHVTPRPDVRYVPLDEARAQMGPFADALALDQVVRSDRSLALGWSPAVHALAANAPRLLEEWRRAQATLTEA